MEKRLEEEKWAFENSRDYATKTRELDEEEEEEALSLCDLPIIHHQFKTETEEEIRPLPLANETEDDFDFCSLSKESNMCAADEVFFQGQILPLRRHSVSSETGQLYTRPVSRSESMDRFYSGGLISSRSSSISSHHSSSSGTSSSATTTQTRRRNPNPPRNQFHSHPSPSPRIHHPPNKKPGSIVNPTSNITNPSKKSSVWSIFRLGLVIPPPEIAFHDLKTRKRTNSGSRNSTSSSDSNGNYKSSKNLKSEEKKSVKNPIAGFLNGCKCSVNDAVPSRIVVIKRNASENEETRFLRLGEEEELEESVQPTKRRETKKRLSHHRTFEWLKQLSIEGAEDDEDA